MYKQIILVFIVFTHMHKHSSMCLYPNILEVQVLIFNLNQCVSITNQHAPLYSNLGMQKFSLVQKTFASSGLKWLSAVSFYQQTVNTVYQICGIIQNIATSITQLDSLTLVYTKLKRSSHQVSFPSQYKKTPSTVFSTLSNLLPFIRSQKTLSASQKDIYRQILFIL